MSDEAVFSEPLERRLRVLIFLTAVGFFILVFRLFQLQVLRGAELSRQADLNRTQIIPLQAPRGLIMDRTGEVMIDNMPSFSLFYSAQSVPRDEQQKLEEELAGFFPEQTAVLRRKMLEARRSGKMVRVFQGVPRETALALIERKLALPGINVFAEPKRWARFGALASHVLGYVDEVSQAEIRRSRDEFKMGQLVGKMGLERINDSVLRGVDGGLQFEMDAVGHYVRTMQQIPSTSGNDIVLTLDRRVQQALEEALEGLGKYSGAAVAIDPRTGAVIAMASHPNFDPSESMAQYLNDKGLPFFNRALQGAYPPGSVFKMLTAAALLRERAWNIHRVIPCPGVFHLGKKDFGCWKIHGNQNFMDAMAWSCDVYFYNMGLKAGPDALERVAKEFGFGEKTGIDLPLENAGTIPGREWKKKNLKVSWFDGDTVNYSIGQGFVTTTPLQVAIYIAALANNGTVWKPYVMDKVMDPNGQVLRQTQPQARRRVEFTREVWSILHRSMQAVVQTGTGRGVWRPDLVVGGKTGTAQNPHGEGHAWFACYAGLPGEPSEVAVAVIVENAGHGSTYAVPVARAIVNAVFPPPEKPRAAVAPNAGVNAPGSATPVPVAVGTAR